MPESQSTSWYTKMKSDLLTSRLQLVRRINCPRFDHQATTSKVSISTVVLPRKRSFPRMTIGGLNHSSAIDHPKQAQMPTSTLHLQATKFLKETTHLALHHWTINLSQPCCEQWILTCLKHRTFATRKSVKSSDSSGPRPQA